MFEHIHISLIYTNIINAKEEGVCFLLRVEMAQRIWFDKFGMKLHPGLIHRVLFILVKLICWKIADSTAGRSCSQRVIKIITVYYYRAGANARRKKKWKSLSRFRLAFVSIQASFPKTIQSRALELIVNTVT